MNLSARHSLCLLIPVLILQAGCNPFRAPEYEVRGRVVGFGDDGRTVIVEHQDVPGLMPAMTMPFQALDSSQVARLDYGDAVQFTLAVTRDSSWIYDLKELPLDALPPTANTVRAPVTEGEAPILQPGDAVPPFELVDHKGQPVHSEGYSGDVLLLTFVYTRCPLPEYCPLLSRRFAELEPEVAQRFGGRVHLLSVTIDPEHDTPDVLREYAARYSDDLTHWTFATGRPEDIARMAHWFGVYLEPTANDINHSLATALVGPDGKVRQIWRGNRWSPAEVLEAITQALTPVPSAAR